MTHFFLLTSLVMVSALRYNIPDPKCNEDLHSVMAEANGESESSGNSSQAESNDSSIVIAGKPQAPAPKRKAPQPPELDFSSAPSIDSAIALVESEFTRDFLRQHGIFLESGQLVTPTVDDLNALLKERYKGSEPPFLAKKMDRRLQSVLEMIEMMAQGIIPVYDEEDLLTSGYGRLALDPQIARFQRGISSLETALLKENLLDDFYKDLGIPPGQYFSDVLFQMTKMINSQTITSSQNYMGLLKIPHIVYSKFQKTFRVGNEKTISPTTFFNHLIDIYRENHLQAEGSSKPWRSYKGTVERSNARIRAQRRAKRLRLLTNVSDVINRTQRQEATRGIVGLEIKLSDFENIPNSHSQRVFGRTPREEDSPVDPMNLLRSKYTRDFLRGYKFSLESDRLIVPTIVELNNQLRGEFVYDMVLKGEFAAETINRGAFATEYLYEPPFLVKKINPNKELSKVELLEMTARGELPVIDDNDLLSSGYGLFPLDPLVKRFYRGIAIIERELHREGVLDDFYEGLGMEKDKYYSNMFRDLIEYVTSETIAAKDKPAKLLSVPYMIYTKFKNDLKLPSITFTPILFFKRLQVTLHHRYPEVKDIPKAKNRFETPTVKRQRLAKEAKAKEAAQKRKANQAILAKVTEIIEKLENEKPARVYINTRISPQEFQNMPESHYKRAFDSLSDIWTEGR